MITDEQLHYIVNHVFLPPKLPQEDDFDVTKEHALCALVYEAAEKYSIVLPTKQRNRWSSILNMLKNIDLSHKTEALSTEQVIRSQPGDVLPLLIRAQNAGIIMRHFEHETIFESFEVSPQPGIIMATKGKLLCSYPGPAIAVPRKTVDDPAFRQELASFLSQMSVDILDSSPTTKKANSVVQEERDTPHPRYITQLLTEILRGIGQVADVTRIRKRIADDVLWLDAFKPWRRSSMWLLIRVALQTSLYRMFDEHNEYKRFMIFMMARTLHLCLKEEFPSDLVVCIRAKISRRLLKLGSATPAFVLEYVHDAGNKAQALLQQRWTEIQINQAESAYWAPDCLDMKADTHLSLVKSKTYLSQVFHGAFPPDPSYTFRPDHFRRFKDSNMFRADLLVAFTKNAHIGLLDFETAVQDHLDSWVDINRMDPSGCIIIASCITQYCDAALAVYKSNPEAMSTMLLTIFDLWVGLDTIAVTQCTLLREYSPEFPLDLLETLLLHRSKSFGRLKFIGEYLRKRHSEAVCGSVFTDVIKENNFAIRYYNTSERLHSLRERIEKDAAEEQRKKVEELKNLNGRHQDLSKQAHSLEHNYWTDFRGLDRHSSRRCTKCSLQSQASNLSIDVYEWPLPQNHLEIKAVVFELCPPVQFSVWRSSTYKILRDICMLDEKHSDSPFVLLDDYPALTKYYDCDPMAQSRIVLASSTKSFSVSHYRKRDIPSNKASVCVNNGLQFRLFDKFQHEWAAHSFDNVSVAQHCTLQLPRNSYQFLQYAVDGTFHTSNEILANQSECPHDLTLHEQIAFASLRSGPRLQWLNITRELRARSLSFSEEAVLTLLAQTVWQIGPLSKGIREWHEELDNPDFGRRLLDELNDLFVNIQVNWLEVVSMRTITILTSRLLASTKHREVIDRAYTLMRDVRTVTFEWMHQLAKKLQQSEDESQLREFQLRVCEMAASCRGTYDVDPEHARDLLSSSSEDVSILVECAILLHDNTPPGFMGVSSEICRLIDRDRRLSHSLEALLFQRISESREGLDCAVTTIWAGYRLGCGWERLVPPNDQWITTKTAAKDKQMSQSVQINLLEGKLLVEGKPLGRLPTDIVTNPIYRRILGQKILDVVPADMPGMEFVTRGFIYGHQIFFGLRNSTSLVIRIRKSDLEIFELVPHLEFSDDLPTPLVENYVHWFDLSKSKIELRPIERLWESSDQNWWIDFSVTDHSVMYKDMSLHLVDIRSPTMDMISARVGPLESRGHLTVTYAPSSSSLVVHLPRFRLSFSLNQGQLESQNMPGMLIDTNQSSGTMFGLSSQLVLCAKDAKELSGSRHVIIPYGDVHFKCQGAHTHTTVDISSQISARYQEYTVDTNLGRLVGNASMINRLYKIYLHAVTSHCLPDPLTGRTGTEEALHELRSAGCLSFQKLGDEEMKLLRQISSLTPSRSYYPAHLEVMQSVSWSNLPPTAQHYDFYALTGVIVEYAKNLQVFHEQAELKTYQSDSSSADLLRRAAHRNTLFYPEEFSGPLPSGQDDTVHISRDLSVYGAVSDECAVVDVSAMVYGWPSSLATCTRLLDMLKSWDSLRGSDKTVSLSYSRDWLERSLAMTWISLYNLCRESSKNRNIFQMMFSFSALAYRSCDSRELIPTLLAFATVPRFRDIHPPSWSSYDLSEGFHPDAEQLLAIVFKFAVSFEASPEFRLPSYCGEDMATLAKRRFSAFQTRYDLQAKELVTRLIDQWPCAKPHCPPGPADRGSWLFDIPELTERVGVAFEHWYHNSELQDHVHTVQVELDRVRSSHIITTRHSAYRFESCSSSRPTIACHIEFGQFVRRKAPGMGQPPSMNLRMLKKLSTNTPNTNGLRRLFSEFQEDKTHQFRRLYGTDLDHSRERLEHAKQTHTEFPDGSSGPSVLKSCIAYRDECQENLKQTLSAISRSLSPSNKVEDVIFTSGQWPRLTIYSLLGKLAFKQDTGLTEQWKSALISLAQAVLWLQRSQRLLKCAQIGNWEDFLKEVDNDGTYQNEITYSDWLLIQIDNNFLVRPVQIQVAREMIEPSSNRNTALQLNMGEGKSSVIVPMVAAALSDGQRFVRVIVLKSLATQMFQLLVERLSCLTNRRIFYMPFSRSTLTVQQVQVIHDLYTECMRVGGVLITQPEHILSFKLMGIDRLFNNTAAPDIADRLLESQRWLEDNSRDILDESDEILHVRYQLVYTIGQQCSLDGHPDRWTMIQQLLSVVKKRAPEVQQLFPLELELHNRGVGCYPQIRILDSKASAKLVSLVANDVMLGALDNCSFQHVSTCVRTAVFRFVTDREVSKEDADLLEEHCKGTGLWKALLLLRGMFVHGILEYVLKERRWRVDYGLDPSRSLMAVPYRAKDVPSLRAEFGHPDVAIALTCFSYYYFGLSKSQLKLCFMLLVKQDNPQLEYEKWFRNNDSIPEQLRWLSGINTKDPEQQEQIVFPRFRLNHPTIDFFLSEVVFPKGAKEFPEKLATSGWDLAESKHHITTGFSGTNDGRYLLPTSIIQDDPVDQLSTNAKVLTYLLQLENDHYLPTHREGEFPSAEKFLGLLVEQTPEIRVLLDVGAQMLEFQNGELAFQWLKLRPDVPAAIFFDDDDELVVLTHDDNIEPFICSPFKQQLDKCLVYLDDAHTRGTDLKLPRNTRAAVTLGPKVTKDRLLQGCMRMRKLGHGQSVMFFAPLEVDRAIRGAAKKEPSDQVKVLDVLRWAMLETCADVIHHVPHWAQQGLDHARRQTVWKEFSSLSSPVELLKSWLQREARTLEEMYGLPAEGEKISHPAFKVPELGNRCQKLGVLSFSDTALEEEQEREVSHEIERECEIQRPPKATPAKHQVHKDVRMLVETGRITNNSSQFVSIFFQFGRSAATARSSNWSPNLLATKDFSITIEGSSTNSDYLRPVNWIISSTSANGNGPLFVVLSPYEVDQLLPWIRRSEKVHLHQYAPRVNQAMKSFDDLAFYCIPPLAPHWTPPTPNLRNQLNLWSGQLYLSNRETYQELCDFLGLYTEQGSPADDMQVRNDGFIGSWCHRKAWCPFANSPVPFLKEFVSSRRKGMGHISTHLGKILHGRLLTHEDF